MNSTSHDFEDIQGRLQKLERLTRRFKGAGTLALIVVTALLVMGQAASSKKLGSPGKQEILDPTLAQGRYQIIVNPSARADTFLLDTQTGQTRVHTAITNYEGDPEI
jgi:hypothetical protein